MKKIVRLTERDLTKLVKRVINEQSEFGDINLSVYQMKIIGEIMTGVDNSYRFFSNYKSKLKTMKDEKGGKFCEGDKTNIYLCEFVDNLLTIEYNYLLSLGALRDSKFLEIPKPPEPNWSDL